MESSIQHVERKALQRRLVPQLQYKSSQSQEDDLDEDDFLKKELTVKSEEDDDDEDDLDDMIEVDPKVEPDETFLDFTQGKIVKMK